MNQLRSAGDAECGPWWSAIADGVLQLGSALLAGAPPSGMQVSPLVGFCGS